LTGLIKPNVNWSGNRCPFYMKAENMNKNRISPYSRILLIACSLALVAVLFVPMWRIDLVAPQYPEGLKLLIFANKLGGNVDIINGLNHYIGMKTLHTEDFIEFRVLPILIGFFVLAFLLVGILGRRKWMNLLLILFILFGVTAMVDFWRWEYNYGHNLDPDAAIIVPGMSYQPPLIGFKQLLNFGAYSMPDIGGWIFVGAGMILLMLVVWEWWKKRKNRRIGNVEIGVPLLFLVIALNGCSSGPEKINPGKDHCSFCRMTISDPRFACELKTKKGKVYKFDDTQCMLGYIKAGTLSKKDIGGTWFSDYSMPDRLFAPGEVSLCQGDCFKGPMNGNIVAFSNADSMKKHSTGCSITLINWDQLNP